MYQRPNHIKKNKARYQVEDESQPPTPKPDLVLSLPNTENRLGSNCSNDTLRFALGVIKCESRHESFQNRER